MKHKTKVLSEVQSKKGEDTGAATKSNAKTPQNTTAAPTSPIIHMKSFVRGNYYFSLTEVNGFSYWQIKDLTNPLSRIISAQSIINSCEGIK